MIELRYCVSELETYGVVFDFTFMINWCRDIADTNTDIDSVKKL